MPYPAAGLSELAAAVLAAPPRLGQVRLVAVDGPSGAGKSTFAAKLSAALGSATIISTDSFATWADPVGWWPRLAEGVLEPLARGEPGHYVKLDWTSGTPEPGEHVTVPPPEILILEGVSAGRASVRPLLSALVVLDGPGPAERLERAVRRDGEAARPHLERWQEFERGWFAIDNALNPFGGERVGKRAGSLTQRDDIAPGCDSFTLYVARS
ncbi:uridine kinase family protein [Amycolatopsis alkalitolerans]|uniref:uridine kinase family protein n=1 Tax=Amycolatopsis alkalitolerans TaxID=2547244 RepID=UPI001F1DFAE0|nr:uridine kinase [Amycolatopsis alkalitolerans]